VKIKRLHPDARIPFYASRGAACVDLACVEGGTVPPRTAHTFRTGLSVEVPEGHVLLVFSRSGHGFKHGLRLANAVGVIDSDYRGELMVRLHNDHPIAFSFEPGDRIAQALLMPVVQIEVVDADDLDMTERGYGGFGSTGN
jgi:dUTP pyrophosphatase